MWMGHLWLKLMGHLWLECIGHSWLEWVGHSWHEWVGQLLQIELFFGEIYARKTLILRGVPFLVVTWQCILVPLKSQPVVYYRKGRTTVPLTSGPGVIPTDVLPVIAPRMEPNYIPTSIKLGGAYKPEMSASIVPLPDNCVMTLPGWLFVFPAHSHSTSH